MPRAPHTGFAGFNRRKKLDPHMLRRDRNGNLRTEEEMKWPIKARCGRCGGKGTVTNAAETYKCGRCDGRGYHFLPLGI